MSALKVLLDQEDRKVEARRDNRARLRAIAESDGEPPPLEWDSPTPFYEHDSPPFPANDLPLQLRSYVLGVARETQTPVDMSAVLALAVLAGAVAGHVCVQPRPGWIEPTNLYVVGVMPPGERKSAVFAKVVEPLEEIERALVLEKRDQIARAVSEYRMKEEEKARLEKDATKADNPEDRRTKKEEAVRAAQQLAAMKPPVLPRLLVSDVTPEVLVTHLAEQSGRMCLFSPEGDLFDMLAGRYSNGTPHFDVILKAHCGDTIRNDRRGRSEFVRRPALTIGIVVQPEVVRGLVDKPGFRGRGLLARILYVWPTSLMGQRRIAPEPLSDHDRHNYTQLVKAFAAVSPLTDPDGNACPRRLYLNAEAAEVLKRFESELEPKLSADGELGAMADWAGKLAGAIVRLAGVLWLIKNADNLSVWPDKIDADTVRSAINIGNYLTLHARAAFAEMGGDEQVENAKRLLRWIEKSGNQSFTRRDAHQANRSRFKTVDEIDPALDLLEDHGHIRAQIETDENRRRGRKASRTYLVNPNIFETGGSVVSGELFIPSGATDEQVEAICGRE